MASDERPLTISNNEQITKGCPLHKLLPNTYFLNMDGVLYHCVREGSKSFEAVVVPKKIY